MLKLVPKNAVCAEIGVWKGDFSALVLQRKDPRRSYLIDPWEFVESRPDAWYGGRLAHSQQDMDAVYEAVCRRFARLPNVKIMRMASIEAARLIPDEFDWIYVDGDHTFEGVQADLIVWWEKLKPGGWLTGDDYGLAGWWENGVQRAVDEFARERRLQLKTLDTQFMLRKT